MKQRFSPLVGLLALAGGACGGDNATGPGGDLQPAVVSAAPDSGNVGTGVAISGSNFAPGFAVAFGGFAADSVEFVDATTVIAYAPGGLLRDSVYDLRVINSGGKSATLVDAYKAVAPTLEVVNGVSKPSGNTSSTVILEGKAFGDLVVNGKIYFSDAGGQAIEASVAPADNWTNEFIVTTVPGAAATGPVWLETPTGASDSIVFTITQAATFSPSQINWTATTSLPDSSQGHGAVYLSIENGPNQGQLIYLSGGADGALAPRTSVYHATIGANGQLGIWVSATALPQPRAFHGAAVATPFNALIDTLVAAHLYAVGGIDASGAPMASVYTAVVSPDRSVANWTQTSSLPAPLHSMGVTVFRSWLYVAGGATTGDAPVNQVYRARINQDGSLGTWESQSSLPYALAYARLSQFGGKLYVAGGDTAANAPGDASLSSTRVAEIHYSGLNLRTAEIETTWTRNSSELIKKASKHSGLISGGWMLVSGGLYNGSGNSSTEHQYASINPSGTIGSFSGATGSQTIVGGAGGVPFFNHAAITYTDAAGNAHVVILGGGDVNDPSRPVPDTYFY